ncbi:hypothetical protein ABZ721_29350 [Streptomyces sp. NPDC006733]|uniref:hypothetical protein n=1 Tax=Streptomyces sp. NPDC006733 TaxID=3155460 RepID=UPI00340E3FA2
MDERRTETPGEGESVPRELPTQQAADPADGERSRDDAPEAAPEADTGRQADSPQAVEPPD